MNKFERRIAEEIQKLANIELREENLIDEG